eukprot:5887007-Pyramimonas_sp.AAC.2
MLFVSLAYCRLLPPPFSDGAAAGRRLRQLTNSLWLQIQAQVNVRVYIIAGINLMPKDKNNLADPYLCVELAGIKKVDRESRIEESTQVTVWASCVTILTAFWDRLREAGPPSCPGARASCPVDHPYRGPLLFWDI